MRRKIGNDEFSIRKQDKAAWLAASNSVRQRRSQEISGVFGAISRDFKIVPVSFALSSFKIACYAVLKRFFEFETQKGKRKWQNIVLLKMVLHFILSVWNAMIKFVKTNN